MQSTDARPLRLIHVSDIHFWRYDFNPLRLMNKRLLGMGSLVVRRARKFRLERVEEVVRRVLACDPDHILITGDLTTTALSEEFRAAREELAPWLTDPSRVTIIPGNHDRYTAEALRNRRFEEYFGGFSPAGEYPWLRPLDETTAILGLDPTRPALTARGRLPEGQLDRARKLLESQDPSPRRLIVACHYPIHAPLHHRRDLKSKELLNAAELDRWLATIGPHVYCCGHVHAAWAHLPEANPRHLCLNAGAPLLRDRTGDRPPGFLEILLNGADITVRHHHWKDGSWVVAPLHEAPAFFESKR